jgi:predicted nucleotidyltransferase
MLTAKDVINKLKPHISQLTGMKVKRLALFGSRARGDPHPGSDFDFLVEFSVPVTFDLFFDLKHFLEDLLGGPVDLVTLDSLKPALKPYIEKDLIDVA